MAKPTPATKAPGALNYCDMGREIGERQKRTPVARKPAKAPSAKRRARK